MESVLSIHASSPWVLQRSRLGSALFALLDRCIRPLPEDQDELLRRRMVAAMSFFQLVQAGGIALILARHAVPRFTLALCLLCIPVALSVLVLLRRGTSLFILTGLISGWPLTMVGIFGLHADGAQAVTGPWVGVIVLLVLYLAGQTAGLYAALYSAGLMICSYVAIHTGHTLSGSSVPRDMTSWLWWQAPIVVFTLLSLGSLQISAQLRAVRALREAIATAEDAKAKLKNVLENTSDSVASLDADLRLQTFNSAMKSGYGLLAERPLTVGELFFDAASSERLLRWQAYFARALAGEPLSFQDVHIGATGRSVWEVSLNPAWVGGGGIGGVTLFARDITARTQLEEQAVKMNQELVRVSRLAGMTEVATGILHNVGNTLNSVSVSATLLQEALVNLPVTGLTKIVDIMHQHQDDIAAFMESPRGKKLPLFLATLSLTLEEERQTMDRELYTLLRNVDHIKHVVSMQQSHAKPSGVIEKVRPEELVDDALKLHEGAFTREGILLQKDLEKVAPLSLDRHRVLQILVNLFSNARHATLDSAEPDKVVTVRIRSREEGGLVIEVQDNGVGIDPQNADRIFQQGFTTKVHGHGFGLHNSILIAKELGGSLSYRSEGPGRGACFRLSLPDAGRSPTAAAPRQG